VEHGAPSNWGVGQWLGRRLLRAATAVWPDAATMRRVEFASQAAKHGNANRSSAASRFAADCGFAGRCGGALTEILIVIGTLGVLAALLLPRIAAGRAQAHRIDCVSNLKELGLGARIWSNDHDKSFPWQVSTNDRGTLEFASAGAVDRLILPLTKKLNSAQILACPSDKRRPAETFATFSSSNLSYFIGLDALDDDPRMILCGDRNIGGGQTINEHLMLVGPNAAVTWGTDMHFRAGNICLADGSVQQVKDNDLQKQVSKQTNSVRFAIP